MPRRKKPEGVKDPVTGITRYPYVEPKWATQVEPVRARGGRTGGHTRPISLQDQQDRRTKIQKDEGV